MKILGITLPRPAHNKAGDGALYNVGGAVVRAKVDSTLLVSGKPFFVPDWCERVDYGACLALRVCRLGKSVPARFAHRYYDAATIAAEFTARDVLEKLIAQGLPWDSATSFDNALALGRWVGLDALGDLKALDIDVKANGATVQSGRIDALGVDIDEAVSSISRLFTLKTGDIILFGPIQQPTIAAIGDHIEGTIGSEKVLDFSCK